MEQDPEHVVEDAASNECDNGVGEEHAADDQATSSSSDDDDLQDCDLDDQDDLVLELQSLIQGDKIDLLCELVKSRTEKSRLKHQLEVYKCAMEKSAATTTKLKLDLAYSKRMMITMQEAAAEHVQQSQQTVQQFNLSADIITEMDMKRLQLLKDSRGLQAQIGEYQERLGRVEAAAQARKTQESDRNNQLQATIEQQTTAIEELKQQLVEIEETHQAVLSSHSDQQNEIDRLNADLTDARNRIAAELQSKETLRENAEMLLSEKTQLAMEMNRLEVKIDEIDQEKKAKLWELDVMWQAKYNEAINKCETLNLEISEIKKQMNELQATREKQREESDAANKNLANEKDQMKMKIGGMQTMLDDRNNEICTLHAKLNGEQKQLEEQKQQFEQKLRQIEAQLSAAQKVTTEESSKIEQIQKEKAELASKLSAMETQIANKDKENSELKNKLSEMDKSPARIAQLEQALADQTTKVASLEQQLKAKPPSEDRSSMDSPFNPAPDTAQITSTPLRPIDSNKSPEVPIASKKKRMIEPDAISIQSSVSNYSTFQSSVDRKRAPPRFFARKSPKSEHQQQQPQQPRFAGNARSFFKTQQSSSNDELNISLASTINLDEEPLVTANNSSGSSVPLVKPFFRKFQDKK